MGLLERLPQRINERPPPYFGRNDLETLLSSGDCADWVKIRYLFNLLGYMYVEIAKNTFSLYVFSLSHLYACGLLKLW